MPVVDGHEAVPEVGAHPREGVERVVDGVPELAGRAQVPLLGEEVVHLVQQRQDALQPRLQASLGREVAQGALYLVDPLPELGDVEGERPDGAAGVGAHGPREHDELARMCMPHLELVIRGPRWP